MNAEESRGPGSPTSAFPHPHLRPTAYRPDPGCAPQRLQRAHDGHVYGWVRMVPDAEAGPPGTSGEPPLERPATASPPVPGGAAGPAVSSHERIPVRPHAIRDLKGYDNRPDPLTATTPERFVARMREFRAWSGEWSYRELEQFCGGWVSRSHFHATLTGAELPKYMVLCAFISACGGDADELQRWVTAWRRLRMPPGGEADPTLRLVHSAEAESAQEHRTE